MMIQLNALTTNHSAVSIQAVVDTGFNGFLTLPTDVLNALGLAGFCTLTLVR